MHFHLAGPVARAARIMLASSLLLLSSNAFGQQSYVGRYDIYGGYAFLNSSKISLAEHGFQTQVGMRVRTWVSLGFDYTIVTGDAMLTSSLLPTSLQQQLGAQLAQLAAAKLIPASYSLSVPLSSKTEAFSAGTQFAYRHFKAVTIFFRPDLGAIHESAVPHPTDPIATSIVAQLDPSGKKQDWTYFYGFGGGFDFNIGKHFSLRVQADLVRDHLFDDLLKDARNTVRFSIGPGFQWGRNVVGR